MRGLVIRLQDENGKVYRWKVHYEPRAVCFDGSGKSRITCGWYYTDHEGYTRFSEGNWRILVAHFKATAKNYGLTLMSELS